MPSPPGGVPGHRAMNSSESPGRKPVSCGLRPTPCAAAARFPFPHPAVSAGPCTPPRYFRECSRRLTAKTSSARSSGRIRRLRDACARRASISANMARILASEAGLSTTTTSDGLLEEARTRPQVPSSRVTRTPLTVTTLRRSSGPAAFRPCPSGRCIPSPSPRPRHISCRRGRRAPWWASPRFCGRPSYSADNFLPPARSSISSTWMPATMPSS